MLIDTSGLLALLGSREPQHAQAVKLFDQSSEKFTHNYVIAEFVALATVRHFLRSDILEFITDLQDTPEVQVIFVDEALHRAALALLEKYQDKEWSLCDAVSFVLMSE